VGRVLERARRLAGGLLPASRGVGPLLQRDYWAVIDRCELRPSEIASLVAQRFAELSPAQLAAFRRTDGTEQSLRVGDEMEVAIPGAGRCLVRVVHRDANSLTLGTLEGHPEAGRITFGAYRNERGDVVFHIRSRARSSSALRYVGFLGLGEAMQTNVWTDFVNAVALTAGDGVVGVIRASTTRMESDEAEEQTSGPTFVARGD
jgi:hypothetical protein